MSQSQTELREGLGALPICRHCGSERVAKDAFACWNPESGLWELESVFDAAHCHQCEGQTKLVWIKQDSQDRRAVREINDRFRIEGRGNGSIVITVGIQAKGQAFVNEAMKAVRTFSAFSEDNDPWAEHDFGAVEIDGERIFWKIDYYDLSVTYASPNPANESATFRTLTIMLASEY